MEAMIDDEVRPRLRAASGEQAILSSRVLHTWGFGESQIAELLNDLYESANPSIAFLISGPEVRIRITAKGPAEKDVDTMIRRVEDEIRTRLGSAVFGSDDVTVDAIVVEQLSSRGATLAIVESSTAGLVTARLASTPGFVGGAVVTTEAIDDVEARAIELADGCTTSADVVIAISEFVSEGQGNNMAAQRVGVAIRTKNALCVRTLSMLGDTERAQQFAVPGALHVLRQTLATV
jgi:nicotinamide-nucleotide amidase